MAMIESRLTSPTTNRTRYSDPILDLRSGSRSLFLRIARRAPSQLLGFGFAQDASQDELVVAGMPRVDVLPLALLADRFSADIISLYGLVHDPRLDQIGLAHPSLRAVDSVRKVL